MVQTASERILRRTPSIISHISEANTIVEPASAHGTSLLQGRPAARQAATPHRPSRRTFMILIKASAQDRAEIKAHMEQEEQAGNAASHTSTSIDRLISQYQQQPQALSRVPSNGTGASDDGASTPVSSTTAAGVNPNDYLINWALKTYNIDPRNDMVILVNVRPLAASTKTKWYDSSIAAYAQLYDAEERAKSIRLLQKYLNGLWARGYQCRALALLGDKREEITSCALDEHVDSIVAGQPRKQKSLMMGMRNSFVSNLVSTSEVPVSVVRLPHC